MKCNQCNRDMTIVGSKITSDEGSVDVYCVQEFACTNSNCGACSGNDLTNPKMSVKGTPIKLN